MAGFALITVFAAFSEPGVNGTAAGYPIVTPAIVPVTLAIPATAEAVSTAVYVPFPLSVTALNCPADVLRRTVPLLFVRLLLYQSLAWISSVEVLVPSEGIEDGLAVIVVFCGLSETPTVPLTAMLSSCMAP